MFFRLFFIYMCSLLFFFYFFRFAEAFLTPKKGLKCRILCRVFVWKLLKREVFIPFLFNGLFGLHVVLKFEF